MALTQERLRELFNYDPDTGLFIRRIATGRHGCHRAGQIAGVKNKAGYIQISVDKRKYYAHHLVWLYVYGYLPKAFLDHINQLKSDNKIINLREATRAQNMHNRRARANNSLGIKGVSLTSDGKKYRARIRANGVALWLGVFDDAEEAASAYANAAKLYHGEFASSI